MNLAKRAALQNETSRSQQALKTALFRSYMGGWLYYVSMKPVARSVSSLMVEMLISQMDGLWFAFWLQRGLLCLF